MDAIRRNTRTTRKEPWTISSWIRDAIEDKLAHQERARVQREKRRLTKARKLQLQLLADLAGLERPIASSEG